LINGKDAKPHGYVAIGHEIAKAVEGQKKITVEEGFDMAMVPVSDGLAGYSSGRIAAKPLGLNVRGKPIPVPVRGGYRPIVTVLGDEGAGAGRIYKVKTGVVNVMDENANAIRPKVNPNPNTGNRFGKLKSHAPKLISLKQLFCIRS
jgi:hypothetical protein